MSELNVYIAPTPDCTGLTDYYLKSEADKVIAHNKYKRCLSMAMWCEERCARYDELQERTGFSWRIEIDFYFKWYQRWLEIAEVFKEAK